METHQDCQGLPHSYKIMRVWPKHTLSYTCDLGVLTITHNYSRGACHNCSQLLTGRATITDNYSQLPTITHGHYSQSARGGGASSPCECLPLAPCLIVCGPAAGLVCCQGIYAIARNLGAETRLSPIAEYAVARVRRHSDHQIKYSS